MAKEDTNLSLSVTDKPAKPKSQKYGWIDEMGGSGSDIESGVNEFKNLRDKGIPLGKDMSLKYRKPEGGGFGLLLEKKF